MGVTMASSAPARALSKELLPALGCPAITTFRPSRSKAPWRAWARTSPRRPANGPTVRRIGLLQKVDFLFREIQRGFDQHAQVDQRVAQHMDPVREHAGQRTAGASGCGFGAGIDQVGHRLGLGQIELVVEEGPLGEFTRPGRSQTGQQ